MRYAQPKPMVRRTKSVGLPKIFIGSSIKGLPVAESLQLGLHEAAECTIWTQSCFDPSKTALESLIEIGRESQHAALILTPDNTSAKRRKASVAPSGNILFELGLFIGNLGRERTFLIHQRGTDLSLPSDLAGVTVVTYAERSDGNLHAALGPVCTRIKWVLERRAS